MVVPENEVDSVMDETEETDAAVVALVVVDGAVVALALELTLASTSARRDSAA